MSVSGQRRPRRIALVKLSAIGDVIHTLPVARALRRAFPDAEVTWVAEAREATLLAGHPDLDVVIAVDSRRWRTALRRPSRLREAWTEIRQLGKRIRAAGFDVVLDLQGLLKSGLLTGLTRAPVRIGFSPARCREPLNAIFTNRRVTPPPAAKHVVEQNLALLAPLDVPEAPAEFCVPIRPDAERRTLEFLAGARLTGHRLVALNPGAGRADKRWPLSHFRRLAGRLGSETGARVLLLWGPGERDLAHAIAEDLAPAPILAPPTDLATLAALLRRSSLVIAGDTGPLHLAAALGAPCLGLFGPTQAERNGPYGTRCRALQSPDSTVAGLDPATVFAAAQELLEGQTVIR